MSTLKVASINNPSASSGGLAISATGLVSGAGLDLITSQSFTAVSSVSINNCFTSAYENYLVAVNITNSGGGYDLTMRLRAGGVDNSSANYKYVLGSRRSDGNNAISGSAGGTMFILAPLDTTDDCHVVVEFMSPQSSVAASALIRSGGTSGSYYYAREGSMSMTVTTSYDGFTLFTSAPSGNSITGSLSVYGYRN